MVGIDMRPRLKINCQFYERQGPEIDSSAPVPRKSRTFTLYPPLLQKNGMLKSSHKLQRIHRLIFSRSAGKPAKGSALNLAELPKASQTAC